MLNCKLETRELIINELIHCDCFILPSYREGTSMSLLEASSIGRPIITTDVPEFPENVIHGEDGMSFKLDYEGSVC